MTFGLATATSLSPATATACSTAAVEAVSDEADVRVRSRPSPRHAVGDDEGGDTAGWVPPHPSRVEVAATADQRQMLKTSRIMRALASGTGTSPRGWQWVRRRRRRHPTEELHWVVVGVGDEAIERHRVCNQRGHGMLAVRSRLVDASRLRNATSRHRPSGRSRGRFVRSWSSTWRLGS